MPSFKTDWASFYEHIYQNCWYKTLGILCASKAIEQKRFLIMAKQKVQKGVLLYFRRNLTDFEYPLTPLR